MIITIHHTHEWRPGHADPLARIERIIEVMDDIIARITASVDNLATAFGNQTSAIADVATAIRNHPSSTIDNGALASLADRLDSIANSINSSTADLHNLAGEESGAPAPETTAPVATDPGAGDTATSPPDADTGIAPDDTLTDPVGDAPVSDSAAPITE